MDSDIIYQENDNQMNSFDNQNLFGPEDGDDQYNLNNFAPNNDPQSENSTKLPEQNSNNFQSSKDEEFYESQNISNNQKLANQKKIQKKTIAKKVYEPLYDQDKVYIYEENPEEYKKFRKRIQNRQSATRVRHRKKNHTEEIEDTLQLCQQENQNLKLQNTKLQAENQQLKNQVQMLEKIVMNNNNNINNNNNNNMQYEQNNYNNNNSNTNSTQHTPQHQNQQQEKNSNNNYNSSSGQTTPSIYQSEDIFYSEQNENSADLEPSFIRSSSNNFGFLGSNQKPQNFFLLVLTIICSFFALGEVSDVQSGKGGDGTMVAIQILKQNKRKLQEAEYTDDQIQNAQENIMQLVSQNQSLSNFKFWVYLIFGIGYLAYVGWFFYKQFQQKQHKLLIQKVKLS